MDPTTIENMSLHTTDASPHSTIQKIEHLQRPTINAGVLEEMQLELEKFEKIAIIFLLSAEHPASYSTVTELCRNMEYRPYIISEYMQSNLEDMREKLVESLCIIGNYEVLQNLGFAKPSELIDDTYKACIPRYTVKVHAAVKVLYKLFESLDNHKANRLLQSIYDEGRITRQVDNDYLELHALHWLQQGYITISRDGTANFINLLKHLKHLDLYSTTVYHDVEHFCNPSIRALDVIDSCSEGNQIVANNRPALSSNNEGQNKIPEIKEYRIKKGLCVIINEVYYQSEEHLFPNRYGSDSDRDNLVKTFKRRNFDIEISENLNRTATKQRLKDISENFDVKKYDCLVVCILSHGYKGGIVTCDGLEISNEYIDRQICTYKLRDVIKLLIVQACQGKSLGDVSGKSVLATDGPRESNTVIDDVSDSELSTDGPSENILRFQHFCRFMSTMEDFVSIRHKQLGSWFIEAVCQVLSKSEIISFSQWELGVKANVQSREGYVDGLRTASQLSEFKSRLTMTVYFPPFVDNATSSQV